MSAGNQDQKMFVHAVFSSLILFPQRARKTRAMNHESLRLGAPSPNSLERSFGKGMRRSRNQ